MRLISVLLCTLLFAAASLQAQGTYRAEKLFTKDSVLNKAFLYYYSRKFKTAYRYFARYIESYGDHEVPLRYLGRISIIDGKIDKAVDYLERAVKADPKSIPAYLILADLYIKMNDSKKTVAVFKKIIEIDRYHERAIISLARFYQTSNRQREASFMLKKLVLAVNKHGGGNRDFLYEAYAGLGNYYYQEGNYTKAIDYYKKLYAMNERNSRVLLILGELYKMTGRFEKAIEHLKNLLELKPAYEPAVESLAECYYILESPKAHRLIEQLIAKNNEGEKQLLSAMQAEIENNDEKALLLFKEVLKTNSNRLSAHIGLVKIYRRQQDSKNLKREAFSSVLLAQRIGAYEISQKYISEVFGSLEAEADEVNFRKEFYKQGSSVPLLFDDKIETLAYDYAEVYSTHAATLDGLKQSSAATVYYQQSLEVVDQLKLWYSWQKNALSEAKLDRLKRREKEIMNKVSRLDNRKYRLLLNMGWLLQEKPLSRAEQALKLQKEAIELIPDYPQANFLSGIIHFNLGDTRPVHYNNSISYFERAIQLFEAQKRKRKIPSSYHFYLGMALEKVDRFAEAENHLKQAIHLDPYNSTYLNYLGYMYSVRGIKLKEAIDLLSRALEDDPENEAYLDSLGWILFKRGQYEEALAQLLQAANYSERKDKRDSVIYFHLAETYFKLKDYSLAHFYYTRALDNKHGASEKMDTNYIKGQISVIENQKAKKKKDKEVKDDG